MHWLENVVSNCPMKWLDDFCPTVQGLDSVFPTVYWVDSVLSNCPMVGQFMLNCPIIWQLCIQLSNAYGWTLFIQLYLIDSAMSNRLMFEQCRVCPNVLLLNLAVSNYPTVGQWCVQWSNSKTVYFQLSIGLTVFCQTVQWLDNLCWTVQLFDSSVYNCPMHMVGHCLSNCI